jgi:hypothetical protein
MLVASEDATPGSVIVNARADPAVEQRLEPLVLLLLVPYLSSTSMLPVSGALQLKT